jgi:hypothetical protein
MSKRDRDFEEPYTTTMRRRPRQDDAQYNELMGRALRRAMSMGWIRPPDVPGIMALYRSETVSSRHALARATYDAVHIEAYPTFRRLFFSL